MDLAALADLTAQDRRRDPAGQEVPWAQKVPEVPLARKVPEVPSDRRGQAVPLARKGQAVPLARKGLEVPLARTVQVLLKGLADPSDLTDPSVQTAPDNQTGQADLMVQYIPLEYRNQN